jgi:transposase
MPVAVIGVDLAKNVFQVHGANDVGRPVLLEQLWRGQMMSFFAQLPPCLFGMEAYASAHHWARKLQGLGHTVRLIAPQFVKLYLKSNKNDAADAEAVCEDQAGCEFQMRPDELLRAADEEVRGRRFTLSPIGCVSSKGPARGQRLRHLELAEVRDRSEAIRPVPAVAVRVRVR